MIEFRFGRAGKLIPLLVAAVFILIAALHESSVAGYTLAFFMSIIIGSVFAKDTKAFGEAALGGLRNPMFPTVAIAIILASIAGKLVSVSGMITALSDILISFDVSSSFYVAMSFLLCCVLSMSTGTSVGTYIVAMPIFFPVGVSLGADPLILVGAVASGGLFGDNKVMQSIGSFPFGHKNSPAPLSTRLAGLPTGHYIFVVKHHNSAVFTNKAMKICRCKGLSRDHNVFRVFRVQRYFMSGLIKRHHVSCL